MEANIKLENIETLARTPRIHTKIKSRVCTESILGASIVETHLQMMIELWEMENEEVYGKEEVVKQQKRKGKAAIGV